MPKISIIMGVYNCAPYLQEALNSLYVQTFQDFEIIMCDDGSSDATYQIAKTNQQNHSNIVLLKNQFNLGLNQTLNKCLSVAKGEYIARMDGDDVSLPERLSVLNDFLDNNPQYAIVSTPMVYFDDNGEFKRGKIREGEPSIQIFNWGSPHTHAPSMVRKSAFDAVNGYTVDKRLIRVEDYNLWMKMYAIGLRGYNLSECLYAMRDDRNAASRRTFVARMNGIYAHYLALITLHLSPFLFAQYTISNFIKGVLPGRIYSFFHHLKR